MDPQQIEQMMEEIGIDPWMLLAIFGALFLFLQAINAAICFFLSSCFKRIPEEHRKLRPGMVWLLMIPCFSIVWNFYVYPALSESYTAAFESEGSNPHGDCGRMLALVYCILVAVTTALSVIPCISVLGCFISPVALVLWILVLVKAGSLKSQISDTRVEAYRDGGI